MAQGYDFSSPGAAASDALVALLTKQEADKRQKMIDMINAENVKSQVEQRKSENLARAQESTRLDAQQAANAKNQELTRASAIAEQIPKGAHMTPELKDAIGPLADSLTVQQGGHLDPSVGEGPTIDEVFGGTTKQNQNEETIQMRGQIAQMTNESKQQALDIQRAVMEGRITDQMGRLALQQAQLEFHQRLADITGQLTQTKVDAANKVKNDAALGVKNKRAELRDLITGIKDNPDLGNVFGPMAGRLPSVRAGSRSVDKDIERLRAMLTLEGRGQLKGQGAVSDWEGRTVGQGETVLDQAGSVDNGKKELERLLSLFQGDTPQSYEEYMARRAVLPTGNKSAAQQKIDAARAAAGR